MNSQSGSNGEQPGSCGRESICKGCGHTILIRDNQLVITLAIPDVVTKTADVAVGVVLRGWALVTWPTELLI